MMYEAQKLPDCASRDWLPEEVSSLLYAFFPLFLSVKAFMILWRCLNFSQSLSSGLAGLPRLCFVWLTLSGILQWDLQNDSYGVKASQSAQK